MSPPTPHRWLAPLAVLAGLAAAAYHGAALTSLAALNGDDAVYLVLGQAIATGQGYRLLDAPGAPLHYMYPPAYPLLLAAVWAAWPAWPANLLAFKAINVVATLLAAAGAWRLAIRHAGLGPGGAALAAALTAFGGSVSMMMDLTMSELTYMAAVVGVLAWVEPRFEALAGDPAPRPWVAAQAAALVVAAMMVKTLGFVLGAAVGGWLLLRRRWAEAAACLAGAVAALSPWIAWVILGRLATGGRGGDYVTWGQENLGTGMLANLQLNLAATWSGVVPRVFAPVLGDSRVVDAFQGLGLGAARQALLAAMLGLALAGFVATARARLRVWHLYLAGFLAFVNWFPWHPARYTATATPLLALAFAAGVTALARWGLAGAAGWRLAARAGAGLAVAIALAGPAVRMASLLGHGVVGDALLPAPVAAGEADRRAFAAWARSTLPADALLVSDRGPLYWLDTGRQGAAYAGPLPAIDPTFRRLVAGRPAWIVVAPGLSEFQTRHRELAAAYGEAPPAFRGPAGRLEAYRLRLPAAAAGP